MLTDVAPAAADADDPSLPVIIYPVIALPPVAGAVHVIVS